MLYPPFARVPTKPATAQISAIGAEIAKPMPQIQKSLFGSFSSEKELLT
jgi:hypothetical protein